MTALLVALSYPCLFAIARGNMEIELFLLIFVAMLSLFQGRGGVAEVLIFLASLVKPFILIFLAITALDRPYRAAGLIVASACTNLFLLYLLGHSNFDALPRYFSVVNNYKQVMALGGIGDLYNNSSFIIGKILLGASSQLVLYITALLTALIVGISYLLACRTLGVFNRFNASKIHTALVFATIFYFPLVICWCIPVSADYRLSYFLMSVYFLVTAGSYYFSEKTKILLLWIYFLILIPKHFIVFGLTGQFPINSSGILRFAALPPTVEITVQSIVNPILMLVLCITLALGLKSNLASRRYLTASPD
jgi:hypothetical protein